MPGGRGGIGGGAVGGGGVGGGGMHGHYGAAAGDVNFRALFQVRFALGGCLFHSLMMFNPLQDFNASKFVVFSSLLVFSILYALKLDGILESWSWWSVFAPLWAWKCIVGELPEGECILDLTTVVWQTFFAPTHDSARRHRGVLRVVAAPSEPAQPRGIHSVQSHVDKVRTLSAHC